MNKAELKQTILSKKAWWIADLLSLITDKINHEAKTDFKCALRKYGDYPEQSQCASSVLVMFVDDIEELEE